MREAVAILGAGNGGYAAAADLTLRGHEVRLFSRTRATLEPIWNAGGITIEGAAGDGFAPIGLVTDDIVEAVNGAAIIMTVVPTTALPAYAELLAPILRDDQVVFINPGHTGGGLLLASELRRAGYTGRVRTCEVSTLTYGCRIQEPGRVKVVRVVPRLPFAAFPGKHAEELYEVIRGLYPAIELKRSVLETGLSNLNAVEHPAQVLLNVGWLEHTAGDYCFYYEGTTPSVGRVIDAVDSERLAVARALQVETKSFVEAFYEVGFTTARAAESGSAYLALHESEPNRYIKGPKTLDHRYLHEDAGHGLVAWAAFGDIMEVETPTIDALISLASIVSRRDYLSEGLTLERMGLARIRDDSLHSFLFNGHDGTQSKANANDRA